MPELEASTAKPHPTRMFGRFALRQLLGKSERCMTWLAFDPRNAQELMLTMPRVQPATEAAAAAWKAEVEHAARLKHPHLAHVVEAGVQDHWPYVAVDRALGITLGERIAAGLANAPGYTPVDAVSWIVQLLEGLAFVHQAGLAHGDVQLHQVLISDQGTVRLMGVAACGGAQVAAQPGHDRANERAMPMDPSLLRNVRLAGERDVLCVGLLLHHLLAAAPALDEPDTARAIARLPPLGREIIRLPWGTPQPVAEALRAIVNRATDRQERQRYHNARTLLSALVGWREADANSTGGPLALLLDRLRTVGHLPAAPGVGARVARMALAEGQRTDEMAEQVLQDMALSFELLRYVNSATVQGTQVSGSGPVLTLRRAIALVGVNGVRQSAAALRPWPGPLSEPHANILQKLFEHVRLAGYLAQVLRPAGYDAEVVYLVATLQNLGRLLVQYHFPEEAEQIRQLMQTLPPPEPGEPEQAGMTEEAAAFAVLGVDIETLGAAAARQWGMSDEVLHMIRRLSSTRPVRGPDTDADVLRIAASAANEVMDVVTQLPANRVAAALGHVAQRYARELHLSVKDIGDGLQAARAALSAGAMAQAARRELRDTGPADPDGPNSLNSSSSSNVSGGSAGAGAEAASAPSDFARTLAARKGGGVEGGKPVAS